MKLYNHNITVASGCDTLACFQQLSTEQIGAAISAATNPLLFDLTVNSIFGTPFGPIEDNITVFNVNKNSFQQYVPTVIGINADEPISFLNYLLQSRTLSKEIYIAVVGLLFGKELGHELISLYPPQNDNRDQLARIEQDAIFNCGNKRLLKDPNMKESYMYVFHQSSPKTYNHWSKNYEWGSCEGQSRPKLIFFTEI